MFVFEEGELNLVDLTVRAVQMVKVSSHVSLSQIHILQIELG